ncbi:MAG: YjgP/YjgQ family permease [Candidatus Brocadiae bacterium]|nr:YjgP/YjgQ family permease [Candidatus Brocadiia bacterium]
MILTRYVLGETLRNFLLTFAGISSILFIALTLSQLHQFQGVTLALVLALFPSLIPEVLLITIPASLLLSITFTIGRLASDNELNALRANGIHLGRLILPGVLLACLLSTVCGWLVHYGVPKAVYARRNLMGKALEGLTSASGAAIRNLRIGKHFIRYKEFRDGTLVEADIFLVDRLGNRESIRAREARLVLDEPNSRLVLELTDAIATFHRPDKGRDVQSDLMFDHLVREIDLSDRMSKNRRPQDMPEDELMRAIRKEFRSRYSDEQLRTEWHRRKALTAAPIAFALAAAPLAMLLRRGGRVAGIGAVVLPIFAVYFILAIGGPRLGEQGHLPPWIAAWLADMVLTAGGLVTFRRLVLL